MKRQIKFFLFLLLFSGFVGVNVLNSTSTEALNLNSYVNLWDKYDVYSETGMSRSDMENAGKALIRYFRGKILSPNIETTINGETRALYNQKELQHLGDVQRLFSLGLKARFVANVLLVSSLLILTLLSWKNFLSRKETVHLLANTLVLSGIVPLLTSAILGVTAALNFTGFWERFHLLVFTNDLWLLDQAEDWLIRMFPEEFFSSIIARIGVNSCLFSIACIGLGLTLLSSIRDVPSNHGH